MGQADPILTKLGAGPAVKKLVETALILSNSTDAQQRNHAYAFMESAIKELEDDSEKKKLDDENPITEEELSNNNTGSRTGGSEQSTENEEPYSGEGTDSTNGEKPMQDMSDTENQFSEMGSMPPGMPQPGMQPGMGEMPNGGGMIVPGLSPDIAQEMGMGMPQMPPMDTNQMMRQMQYTLNDYHKRIIGPMTRLVKQQREAIKELSREIRETRNNSGSMKLDLDSIKKNSTARIRETEQGLSIFPNINPNPGSVPHKHNNLLEARNEISNMDRTLRAKSIYN